VAYLKCTLVGILTGVAAAAVLQIVGVFLVFQGIAATGAGGLVSVSVGTPPILPFVMGFGLGFFVMWRRQRRALHPSR